MSYLVKNIIRFILFILFQKFILNEVPPLHQFIVPYIYFLYILWLPFNINRFGLLVISFAFGLTLDFFTGTPGLHAAPCVLIAYIRPFLLNLPHPAGYYRTELCGTRPQKHGLGSLRFIRWHPQFCASFLPGVDRVAAVWRLCLLPRKSSGHNGCEYAADFYSRNAVTKKRPLPQQ